jgi:hypothetical protein
MNLQTLSNDVLDETVYWKRVWVLLLVASVLPGRGLCSLPVHVDLGFFTALYETLDGMKRTTAFGPLYESLEGPDGETFQALRPLYNRVEIPEQELVRQEFLWPLGTARVRGGKSTWRFLSIYGWNDDVNDPQARSRLWAFPFYFQGRDNEGKMSYGLFPIYGAMKGFLSRDEVNWILFPLYATHAVGDVRTVNILWPFYSRTRGGREDRLRLFPLYGHSRREGVMEKRFVLWPFWTDVRYTHPGASGSGFVFFPFYGRLRMENQETTWILPPLFRFSKGGGNTLVYGPWPFYQSSTGRVEKKYYFPLAGTKTVGNATSSFFLWPIASGETVHHEDHVIERIQVIPFWHHVTWTPKTAGGLDRKYFKFWPLIRYERDGELVKFHAPALWPLRDPGPIQRNFAPFWRLVNYAEAGDRSDLEIGWGLFRHQRRGDASYCSLFPLWNAEKDPARGEESWSVLKGLLGRKRTGDTDRWQLLYLLKW